MAESEKVYESAIDTFLQFLYNIETNNEITIILAKSTSIGLLKDAIKKFSYSEFKHIIDHYIYREELSLNMTIRIYDAYGPSLLNCCSDKLKNIFKLKLCKIKMDQITSSDKMDNMDQKISVISNFMNLLKEHMSIS